MSKFNPNKPEQLYVEHKELVDKQYAADYALLGLKRGIIEAKSDKMHGRRPMKNQEFLEDAVARKQREIDFASTEVDEQAQIAKDYTDEHLDEMITQATELAPRNVEIAIQQVESPIEQITVHVEK